MLLSSSLLGLVLLSNQLVISALAHSGGAGGHEKLPRLLKMKVAARTTAELLNEDGSVNLRQVKRAVEQQRRELRARNLDIVDPTTVSAEVLKEHAQIAERAQELERSYHLAVEKRAAGRQAAGQRASTVELVADQSTWGAKIGLGTPPQPFTLYVDTGRSQTDVGAKGVPTALQTYNPAHSTTSKLQKGRYESSQGFFSGQYYRDVLHLGSLTISNQTFGAITATEKDEKLEVVRQIGHLQGNLGLSISTPGTPATPFENLIHIKAISSPVFTLSLTDRGGSLIFGGIERKAYKGLMSWAPLLKGNEWQVESGGLFVDQKLVPGTRGPVRFSSWELFTILPQNVADSFFHQFQITTGSKNVFFNEDYYLYTVECASIGHHTLGLSIAGQRFDISLASLNIGPLQEDRSQCALALTADKGPITIAGTAMKSLYVAHSYSYKGKKALGIAQSSIVPGPTIYTLRKVN